MCLVRITLAIRRGIQIARAVGIVVMLEIESYAAVGGCAEVLACLHTGSFVAVSSEALHDHSGHIAAVTLEVGFDVVIGIFESLGIVVKASGTSRGSTIALGAAGRGNPDVASLLTAIGASSANKGKSLNCCYLCVVSIISAIKLPLNNLVIDTESRSSVSDHPIVEMVNIQSITGTQGDDT